MKIRMGTAAIRPRGISAILELVLVLCDPGLENQTDGMARDLEVFVASLFVVPIPFCEFELRPERTEQRSLHDIFRDFEEPSKAPNAIPVFAPLKSDSFRSDIVFEQEPHLLRHPCPQGNLRGTCRELNEPVSLLRLLRPYASVHELNCTSPSFISTPPARRFIWGCSQAGELGR